jgi:hypothetical protein
MDEGGPERKSRENSAKRHTSAFYSSRVRDLPILLVSGITFLNGAWSIASILLTRLPMSVPFFLPFGVYYYTRLLTLVIGFIFVYLSFHLYQRNRVAWWAGVSVSILARDRKSVV